MLIVVLAKPVENVDNEVLMAVLVYCVRNEITWFVSFLQSNYCEHNRILYNLLETLITKGLQEKA